MYDITRDPNQNLATAITMQVCQIFDRLPTTRPVETSAEDVATTAAFGEAVDLLHTILVAYFTLGTTTP